MRALAIRHDPGQRTPDEWSRPEGWSRLDLRTLPDLGFSAPEGATAQELNALRPFARLPILPMKPFVLKAAPEDRARALQCLTQAVYYEAAREPRLGQEAVAQVVLNRLRHPAYPKSVCGVVFQGAARATGCQFTFTCDGSMRYAPDPLLWRRAMDVAQQALSGHVDRTVGSATHYHADYVAPYWAPTLVKMTQVGQHIFYRWTGPWGEPPAFAGRYAGREAEISAEVLGGVDPRIQTAEAEAAAASVRQVTLSVDGETRTYRVMDPNLPGLAPAGEGAVLMSARRKPTPEEVRRINANLAALERTLDEPKASEKASAATPTD